MTPNGLDGWHAMDEHELHFICRGPSPFNLCGYCGQHPKATAKPWESFMVVLCPNVPRGRFINLLGTNDRTNRERYKHGPAPMNPYTGISEILAKGFIETTR